VNRVGADALRQAHDLLHVQETLNRSWADQVGLVRFLDIDAGRVLLGIDGGGGDVQLTARADDPHRNLAAVSH
jgi:hypothetical protein